MIVSIPVDRLLVRPHFLWNHQWLLLTSGDFRSGHFNTMTVAWGSLGTMWHRPFVQVVVRPSRHTYTFMEKYDTFTLCAFPEAFREALQLLGSVSGRDEDKIARSGLHAAACPGVEAPGFEEAELMIGARKIYRYDLEPEQFLDSDIESNYPGGDYHRVYFGEILSVQGVSCFDADSVSS
ncbi:MAG TPA: flavin reductase family protein [bacterium]|nr:flavin reductase family protein [bacterium]